MNETLLKQYNYAREACKACLENGDTLVDMRGLKYWASEVERLRNEFKKVGI